MQDDVPEHELIAEARRGTHGAFEELVRKHQEFIVNFIYRITNDRDAALDQSQESFVKAYRSIRLFQGRSTFRTWLAGIAMNTTRTYLKKSGRELPSGDLEVTGEQPTPEQDVERNERRRRIRAALADLKSEQREVIRLCAIEGFSYAEAADILAIPVGTVCSRMNSALADLRVLLSREVRND